MTWEECRRDVPILEQRIGAYPLSYLDNGATTQLPEPVLREMELQYHRYEANVHRGIHYLSEESTRRMEDAREDVRRFLGAASTDEIIFTSGCTAAINLVARSLSFSGLTPEDEILTTQMEHHSNFLPWQEACRRTGAAFRVAPILPDGRLDFDAFSQMLTPRTRLVAVTWVSNVTGCVNPVKDIIQLAHQTGAMVLVDASQAMLPCKNGRAGIGLRFSLLLRAQNDGAHRNGPFFMASDPYWSSWSRKPLAAVWWIWWEKQLPPMTSFPIDWRRAPPTLPGTSGLALRCGIWNPSELRQFLSGNLSDWSKYGKRYRSCPRCICWAQEKWAGCLSFCLDGCSCYEAAGCSVNWGLPCAPEPTAPSRILPRLVSTVPSGFLRRFTTPRKIWSASSPPCSG